MDNDNIKNASLSIEFEGWTLALQLPKGNFRYQSPKIHSVMKVTLESVHLPFAPFLPPTWEVKVQ